MVGSRRLQVLCLTARLSQNLLVIQWYHYVGRTLKWKLEVVLCIIGDVACQRFRKCVNGTAAGPLPNTAKNTTSILNSLRSLFSTNGIHAYVVPAVDEHQSEYVAPQAKRRQFISGFTGSAGIAVITSKKAALWTDGRYFEQAEMQLDCNWILQKSGQPGVPTRNGWLIQELNRGQSVGIDPRLITIASWKKTSEKLKHAGLVLKPVMKNLVDEIWSSKPKPKIANVTAFEQKYSGEKWQSKVTRLRKKMEEKKVTGMVLSLLDDVAWILCLRGQDIPFNPFFFAYVIVTKSKVKLFIDPTKVTSAVRSHLCPDVSKQEFCVQILSYTQLKNDLVKIMASPAEVLWIPPNANYLLLSGINETQIVLDYSPVQLMKAVKNSVEIDGMKHANVKDGVSMVEFFAWLEKQIGQGIRSISEIDAAKKLLEFKMKQKNCRGLSFETISAFGPNGAIIHYRPSKETSLNITDAGLFLVDCGSQFPEGTTDITRTVHFGSPTAFEKEAYTHVLKGSIRLAMVVFPHGVYGRHIDALARSSLWKSGLDYNHGTGHGIGHYLSVHEGPQAIGSGKFYDSEKPLYAGMVQSDEPGYYETGKFGIRLETALLTINATTKYRFQGRQFLTFEPISLVPFQRKLINVDMMDDYEIKWMNDFSSQSRRVLGAELKRQGKLDGYNWLMKNTEPLHKVRPTAMVTPTKTSAGSSVVASCLLSPFIGLVLWHLSVFQ